MSTWTQSAPGRRTLDRWNLDERWSVRRSKGKWFAFRDGTRIEPGFRSAELAMEHAEKLIAKEAMARGTE